MQYVAQRVESEWRSIRILRDTYDGIARYVIQFTGKTNEIRKSLQIRHKSDSTNKKVTQNFKSLVINYMSADDHQYAVERTILFDTILGWVCDDEWGNLCGRQKWVECVKIKGWKLTCLLENAAWSSLRLEIIE